MMYDMIVKWNKFWASAIKKYFALTELYNVNVTLVVLRGMENK